MQTKDWVYGAIAEIGFFATLYYILNILKVDGNLWTHSIVLWLLINISIIACPVVRKCYK